MDKTAVKVVRMFLIDEAFSSAISDSACLEDIVVFFLTGLVFFATLAYLVLGGMTDSTTCSRVVNTEEMNFVMLLLWPKSVECHVNKWVQLATVLKIEGEIKTHRHWPIWSHDFKEARPREACRRPW